MNSIRPTNQKIQIDIGKATGKLILLCWLTIISCMVLKFFGYRGFEIPIFETTINIWVHRFINLILYNCNNLLIMLILFKRKLKIKETISIICSFTILFIISLFEQFAIIVFILEPVIWFLLYFLFIKDDWYKHLLDVICVSIIVFTYQGITMIYKNFNTNLTTYNLIPSLILQIDYYAFMILTIIYVFKKGGFIYGYWKTFSFLLSKRKRIEKDVQQNQNDVQEEIGYKIFLIVLSICQMFLVGTICYFVNGVILEYFIIIFSFFVMRKVFGNSHHAETVIRCTTLAMLVFTIATRTSLPQWLSILCNVFIGCMVAYIMYMWYYFAKYTNSSGVTLTRGMDLDSLLKLSETCDWSDLEYRIIKDYYVNRLKLDNIAIKYHYSVDGIKKLKAKAIKKLNI